MRILDRFDLKTIAKTIISCIAIISLLTSCFFLPKEEEVLAPPLKEPPKVSYDILEIKKSVFERVTKGMGYLVSTEQAEMYFENTSGRIEKIFVKYGQDVKKGDLLARLITGSLASKIRQQEIAVEKVQMLYEQAVNTMESKSNIRLAQLNLELEKIKLDELKKEEENSKLISPIDGTVSYIADVKAGDYVDAYKIIVTVADPKKLQVQYTGDKTGDFVLGSKVNLIKDEETIEGKVVTVPSSAPPDASDKIRSSVFISMSRLPDDAEPGDSIDISYVQVHKENVIVIPKNSIHTLAARNYVHVLEGGIKKERDVEIGEQNETEAEIVNGLSEGDLLIKD